VIPIVSPTRSLVPTLLPALALSAAMLATPGIARSGDADGASSWPTYHGGYRLDGVAGAALPDALVRKWRFRVEGYPETTPVSDGCKVFFTTSKGLLHAVDLKGEELWKTGIEDDYFSSPPFFTDGLVIAGTEFGTLHAFDASTGKARWAYDLGGTILGTANRVDLPGGGRGIIATSQADGSIHCVDPKTGKKLWSTAAIDRCDGSASVGEGRIVMGSCASALHVFSVDRAEKTADIPLGDDGQVAGGAAFAGNTAFVGTRSGHLYAVDVVASEVLWANRDSRRESFTTPAVNDRFVLFGSDDGKLYALARETGKRVWAFDTEDSPSSPVLAGDRVVVTSGGILYLLDLETGRRVWSAEVSDHLTSPAVVAGMVIVGADDGTVSAWGPGD